jgi:hypothetical protein
MTQAQYFNTLFMGMFIGLLLTVLIAALITWYFQVDITHVEFEDDDDLMSDDQIWGKGVVYRLIEEDMDEEISTYEDHTNIRITPEERDRLIRMIRLGYGDMDAFASFCECVLDEITGERTERGDGLEHYYDAYDEEDNDE